MTNQQPNGQTTSLTQNSRTRQITLIGLMTAITCILAPLSIPLPFSPVPISLTNLVIFISVFILGMKDATISFLIYLLLGAVGLPVFASFHAGLSVLAGPTGGYLIGFIFLALIQGFAMKYFDRKLIPNDHRYAHWYGCMLYLRNSLARKTDESFLQRRSFHGRYPVSPRRCC